MYTTKGIEAIATITELRARTSELIDEAAKFEGIMIQKNNEPLAVLVSYKKYLALIGASKRTK
ncbi:MAG: type II toxin-antitoxin system prevent-host-death family antitoxin [Bacteroidetes bacterium]|nr:type II toxin-antitoxin system prevent-host-death family antitoxin [Bacteroidota bacterium]